MEIQSPQLPPLINVPGDTFLDSKYLNPGYWFDKEVGFFQNLVNFLTNEKTINTYRTILFALSIFFFTVIFYSLIRVLEIRRKEKKHLKHQMEEYARHQLEKEKKSAEGETLSKNERWIKTLTYLFSQSSSDWKLSVIEADSMLDDLMSQLGFQGKDLGEKLKGATQDKFRNLTTAWEVHTVRNRIAHEGLAYEISQHEAKRVIALYEKIFREFGYI